MFQCERPRVRDAGLEVVEERRDEWFFGPEPREERQIDIDGLAGLAPPLKRDAADEAKAPPARLATSLQRRRGTQDLKNGAPSS
jgi:hypothetical protein